MLNAAPLTINGAALTRFDNVSFSGFAPEAIQLTVNNPGLLTHFPMNGLSFSSQPTSGQYISATDTQPGGALLILDVTGAVPADGSAFTLDDGWGRGQLARQSGRGQPRGDADRGSGAGAGGHPTDLSDYGDQRRSVPRRGVVLNEQVPLGATGVLTSTPQGSCTPGPIRRVVRARHHRGRRLGAGDGLVPHGPDRHAEHDGRRSRARRRIR